MDQTRLHELEEQCIQNCDPPCTAHCPVHVNIRKMLQLSQEGDFSGAYQILNKSIPFPEIIARTCEQPCQNGCNRESLGGAIRVADIERAICENSTKPAAGITRLPNRRGRAAIIGAGICGMTAGLELFRKGYQVVIFDAGDQPGGRLWSLGRDQLPAEIIRRETALILESGLETHFHVSIQAETFPFQDYDAILIATGQEHQTDFGLNRTAAGFLEVDPVTLQTSQPGVFAGGGTIHSPSTIHSLSDGRRAAISIDRFLQKVSLTASRVHEASYETRLFTRLDGIRPQAAVVPAHSQDSYTVPEAQQEAGRCLQCECMECVKVCEYLKAYGSYPGKYVRDVYNNMSIIMRQRTANKFINSCTLCGLCEEVCPTDFDMGEVNLETRRSMVAAKKMPISAHDFALRDMAYSNSEHFSATIPPADGEPCSYAFFPGCQLAASNPEYIPLIYQDLAAQFPGLGVILRCCGAPAEWSGEEALFSQAAEELKTAWLNLGKPKLLLACSSCHQMIKKILPEVETLPIWGRLQKDKPETAFKNLKGKQFAIHDPCTSRYEKEWQDAIRSQLASMGVEGIELELSRNKTECCGYGGVAWLANPEMVHRIIQRRIHENEIDYLTYCVMCRDLFTREGKPTLHILDLLYGEDPERLMKRRSPDYSQRHENRYRVKQQMLKMMSRKDFEMSESHLKIKLAMSDEVKKMMEGRLILVEDVQKTIEHILESGECFVNPTTGHTLGFYRPNLITYWVEFTREGDVFTILDAYSHRMQVGGETHV